VFTGIVEEIGTVKKVNKGQKSSVLTISADKILSDVKLGDSIAVNGVCLTVTQYTPKEFSVDVMHETLDRSSLASISSGTRVNLERAMSVDGRFGGHIVSGHIDGTGTIISVKRDDNAVWYRIGTGSDILRYIIEKGSITIDGISLTVARITETDFSVSIIPHTLSNTILAYKGQGDVVNLENDCIGKYVEKLLGLKKFEDRISDKSNRSVITEDFLIKHGF